MALIVFNGTVTASGINETNNVTLNTSSAENSTLKVNSFSVDSTSHPTAPVRLIFIHHSSGGNWLATGNGNLGSALNANNYYVSETDYGWDAEPGDGLGDHTDTPDWPSWFNNEKMSYVYNSNYHSAYTNTISNPGGENEIIMFKSCFPLSEVGDSINDEKAIYNSLLPYFAAHKNKLFVLITPPGETQVSSYRLTRDLCNWLTDSDNGWLKGYTGNNVFIFDFYGVLSESNSHHRWAGDHIEHVYASNYDGISPYHDGDDHPNAIGNQKATSEFLTLLNVAYNKWKANQGLTVYASHQSGSYNHTISVVIAANKAANIYYTKNGSIPTKASTLYKGPIMINFTTNLKFVAVDMAGKFSSVYTKTYIIDKTAPKVISTSPRKGAVKVSRTGTIYIKFNEKIKKSINWSRLVVKDNHGKKVKISKIGIKENKLYITTKKRNKNSSYFVYIPSKSVGDYAGNKLVKGYILRFKTGNK